MPPSTPERASEQAAASSDPGAEAATTTRWPRMLDVGLAVGAFVFSSLGMLSVSDPATVPAMAYVLLAVAAVPLLAWRRWPLGVFAACFVGLLAWETAAAAWALPEAYEWLSTTIALVGLARARGWRFTAPIAFVLGGLPTIPAIIETGNLLDPESVLTLLAIASAVVAGEGLRVRQAYLQAARERAELAEQSARQQAQQRADEERLRIARDVHDTVAHTIASINVQAGMGSHMAARNPQQAAAALAAIRTASQTALDELRLVLGMLRADHERTIEPAPGMDDLDRVVALARDAGLDVDVTLAGDTQGLPSRVSEAAYRIVQESVTNAVKYAGDAVLDISIDVTTEHVMIGVVDDGGHRTGTGTPPADTHDNADGPGRPDGHDPHDPHDPRNQRDEHGHNVGGHGLRGLRERSAALGGTFTAGPTDGGGFAVRATLPITPHEPADPADDTAVTDDPTPAVDDNATPAVEDQPTPAVDDERSQA